MEVLRRRNGRGAADPALALPVAAAGAPAGHAGSRRALGWFRISRHRGLVSLVIFLAGWQLVAQLMNNALLLVGPLASVEALGTAWNEGTLGHDLLISGYEFAVGFFPSVAVGIALGMLLGVSERWKAYIDPVLNAWYSTPIIALIPLFILWFGIGTLKTVVLVAGLVFITCTINTDVGIRATDPKLLEAARSFGASRATLFTKVRLPSALPFVITGIRLSVGRGLIGLIVGELNGSNAGIGYRILISSQNFNTGLLLGCVGITAIVGVGLVAFMEWVERKAAPWHAAKAGALR